MTKVVLRSAKERLYAERNTTFAQRETSLFPLNSSISEIIHMLFFKTAVEAVGRLFRSESARMTPPRRSIVLQLEELEPRDVPAAWSAIGPGPLVSTEYGAVGGRVNAVAIAQDIDGPGSHAIIIGTASGAAGKNGEGVNALRFASRLPVLISPP